MAAFREETPMEMGDGDGPDDEGAESSYGIEFTAEDAAVRGGAPRDVVVPSNILSAIAGATPSAAPGYGLLSSSNPALQVDYARDAVIPGEDSVDVTQEGLVLEDLAQDADADEAEPEDATIACLQMVGVIPFILPLFTPRCTLQITYTPNSHLKNGDNLPLHSIIANPPSIAIGVKETNTLLPGNLFTVLMVEVDGEHYLNWALVNYSDQSTGLELVSYEVPTHGRRAFMFVCYSQAQPFQLVPKVGRQGFDLRSFAAAQALDNPVAAVYVTAE